MDWCSSFQFPFQNHSKIMAFSGAQMRAKQNRISQISTGEPSPEKAGVGGSIPSLATTLSQTLTANSRCE